MQLLLSDADNTLWDTNSVYANAQIRLLEDVESYVGKPFPPRDRLGFVRAIDQSIAAKHSSGLRYPPILLTTALLRSALCEPRDELDAEQNEAARQFERELIHRVRNGIPELRDEVSQGLDELNAAGTRIIVFTEGEEARCRFLLEHHQLSRFVSEIKSARKTAEHYVEMARSEYDSLFMVGDQLDVDIAMAKAAGFNTIYFPSGFAPEWIGDLKNVADFTINSFREVAIIMKRL